MSETIRGGNGPGFLVDVNKNNQMSIDAVIKREEAYLSNKFGQTYTISTNVVTLNSANQHLLLYMKNTSSTKLLYNATLEVGYNGGSSNHDRCMELRILAGFTTPSANHTVAPFGNVNFTSGEVAEADGYIWDGVGDGMTTTGGVLVNGAIVGKGHKVYESYGMPIMGLNDYIGVAVAAEEIGKASITIRLFFKDK